MKAVLVEEEIFDFIGGDGTIEFVALSFGSIGDATIAQVLTYQWGEEGLQIGSNAVTKLTNFIESKH